MKEETPFGGFHNRLQLNGFQQEFLRDTEARRKAEMWMRKGKGARLWDLGGGRGEG